MRRFANRHPVPHWIKVAIIVGVVLAWSVINIGAPVLGRGLSLGWYWPSALFLAGLYFGAICWPCRCEARTEVRVNVDDGRAAQSKDGGKTWTPVRKVEPMEDTTPEQPWLFTGWRRFKPVRSDKGVAEGTALILVGGFSQGWLGREIQACCNGSAATAVRHLRERVNDDCGCGIYSVRDRDDVNHYYSSGFDVLAYVVSYGWVVPAEKGYIAERVRIEKLWYEYDEPAMGPLIEEYCKELAERYEVECEATLLETRVATDYAIGRALASGGAGGVTGVTVAHALQQAGKAIMRPLKSGPSYSTTLQPRLDHSWLPYPGGGFHCAFCGMADPQGMRSAPCPQRGSPGAGGHGGGVTVRQRTPHSWVNTPPDYATRCLHCKVDFLTAMAPGATAVDQTYCY